jgi:capsule biosynthesis phosphatase
MVREEKCIVVDIDGTLCPIKPADAEYDSLSPFEPMMDKLREYRNAGYYIILYTSRNMRTYGGNMGLIMANTAKAMFTWLDRHQVPYDEIHFGKPWASRVGFYVDDRAIRPDEFMTLTPEQIDALLAPKVRIAASE